MPNHTSITCHTIAKEQLSPKHYYVIFSKLWGLNLPTNGTRMGKISVWTFPSKWLQSQDTLLSIRLERFANTCMSLDFLQCLTQIVCSSRRWALVWLGIANTIYSKSYKSLTVLYTSQCPYRVHCLPMQLGRRCDHGLICPARNTPLTPLNGESAGLQRRACACSMSDWRRAHESLLDIPDQWSIMSFRPRPFQISEQGNGHLTRSRAWAGFRRCIFRHVGMTNVQKPDYVLVTFHRVKTDFWSNWFTDFSTIYHIVVEPQPIYI